MDWSKLVVTIIVIAIAGFAVWQKRANAKEWLKWAVSQAEIMLGSGTGQLKLRSVYEMFVAQFPWFSTFIPFDTFSKWVDEALEWMKNQIDCNTKIEKLIKGE